MQSICVVEIGGEQEDGRDMVKIVEVASGYFPTQTWGDIGYVGKLRFKHDFNVATNRESYGAFLFKKLINRIRRVRGSRRLTSPLLGITTDPVVAMYHFFDRANFKRALYLVHDYMDEKVGFASLFQLNERTSNRLVAHGLGHNRGLHHHVEPIDLMHSELLSSSTLQVDGFCKGCLRKLKKGKTSTFEHSQ